MRMEAQSAILFELQGDHPGTVNVISEDVFRIGADVENDLVLRDQEIALYQAEIRREPDGFVIHNLATDVPAYLNGEPFETATLQKGDVLTLGRGIFRFVGFGETLRKADLWEPVGGPESPPVGVRSTTFRRISFLAGLTVFAVALVFLAMWGLRQKAEDGRVYPSKGPTVAQHATGVGSIQTLYDRGVALLSARRWDEAVLVFESIRSVVPNYKETEGRYRSALLESRSLDSLNQGKGLYEEGDLEGAKLSLETVPEESLYGNEARQLLRTIQSDLVGEKIREAEASLRSQDWAEARSKAKAVLFLSPNEHRAVSILRESERLSGAPVAGTPGAPSPLEGAAPSAVRRKASPPARKQGMAPVSAPRDTPQWHLQRAVNWYQRGHPERSMDALRPVLRSSRDAAPSDVEQAQEMRNNLLLAQRYFDRARELQEARQVTDAVEMWEKFLETDERLAGPWWSEMFGEASAQLSAIYYDRGKEEYDRGNLGEAFVFWNMAGRIHQKDENVQRGLEQLARSAQEFYREGYSLYDVNPTRAVKKWKEVLRIVPEEDPYHRKARNRMLASYEDDPSLPLSAGDPELLQIQESTRNDFREGYCIQYVNPEGAIARWLEILEETSPSDPYYHKAKAQIEKKRLLP